MLYLSAVLALANILGSMVTCTRFEYQNPLTESAVASKPSIPGSSTFVYCAESDPDSDIFAIEKIVWEPNPPRINREQKLLIYGTFASRIPFSAIGFGDIHIPEWHDPYDPATNWTESGPFCTWPNFVYQRDERRGFHKVCDGADGGNYSAPEAGPAVLVSEDILFWPLPEGEYYFKLDMLMSVNEDGRLGERIFCFEGSADLDY